MTQADLATYRVLLSKPGKEEALAGLPFCPAASTAAAHTCKTALLAYLCTSAARTPHCVDPGMLRSALLASPPPHTHETCRRNALSLLMVLPVR